MQVQTQLQPGQAPVPGDFVTLRSIMVERQIRTFDVTDQHLIARFQAVPRELFAPAGQSALAYSDAEMRAPTVGGPRTILPPLVLARLLQAAEIKAGDNVLDIAGAAGYSAAIVAGLAGNIVALESDPVLSETASGLFSLLGLTNAKAVCGPLDQGYAQSGPYDVIIINGAAESGLKTVISQLASGGRLLTFTSQSAGMARAQLYERNGTDVSHRPLFNASARPLRAFEPKQEFIF